MAGSEYFDHTTYPTTGSFGASSSLRTELDNIEAGFGKLPDLSGNGSKIVAVNSGATALEAITTTGTGNGVRATSPTLTTPVLGVATATTVNKITWTTPATGATVTIADGKTFTVSNTLTFTGTDASSVAFGAGGTVAYTGSKLSAFAATTSAELAGVISDETGSGALVFGTSPTLVTPTIGAATATSVNKVAITAPATSATLTIADGKTLTVSNTLTFTGTDASSVAFGAGGTVTYAAALAATTGPNLLGFSHSASYTAGTLGAKAAQVVSVKDAPYSAVGDGVTNDTAAFQAAIDAVYAAGGGSVLIPAGTWSLGASADAGTLDNSGSSVAANTACLLLKSGVYLDGAGVSETTLAPTSPTLTAIYHISPSSGGVANLCIDGQWTASGAGHGIFVLNADAAVDATKVCKNVRYGNLRIVNVGSYGIGVQNGDIENLTIDNVTIDNVGADGIDLKRRGPNNTASGITLNNIRVTTFGQRLDGQAGIDIRGVANVSNIFIGDVGRSGVTQAGIRFRTYDGAADPTADRSALTNFYVEANTALQVDCVAVGSPDVQISNGVTYLGTEGVYVTGNATQNADRVLISNVRSISAGEYGFRIGDCDSTSFVNCKAISSGTAGFRDTGTNTTFVGCDGPSTTTLYSTGSSSAASQMIAGRNGSNFFSNSSASGQVLLEARGSDTNIDVRLLPKGTGVVRFGTLTANADAPITGYVTIKDAAGTARKLAVIA